MSFSTRFAETRLEREGNQLRLIGKAEEILLELRGTEIDDAVRAGFLDRDDFHFSMFEYARMRAILPALTPVAPSRASAARSNEPHFDRSFLAGLKIAWD
jgi:hypothetical protein